MSRRVAVVTDSTAYLPAGTAEASGVVVVPLQVVIDGKSLAEGVEVDSSQVANALLAGQMVTTSRPSPAEFVEVYRRLQDEGAAAIVSIHLSGEVSGTVDAARAAAAQLEEGAPMVEVVDSRSLGMGMGFGVLSAARAAAADSGAGEVARIAARRSIEASVYFYVDTLDYLRRGGRINAAQARLGSALSVKPLLHLVDGRLEALDRVRTTERAVARLVEVTVADCADRPVDVAVHHLAAEARATDVARRLRERVPGLGELLVLEVGAVVGAHVGPGMVAVVISPVD